MSFVDSYRRAVAQKQKDIADLSHQKAREQARLTDLSKRIASASAAATRATSINMLKSKTSEAERYQNDAVSVSKKISEFEEKISRKYKELQIEQAKLLKEEKNEKIKNQREQEELRKKHDRSLMNIAYEIKLIEDEQAYARNKIKKLGNPPKNIVVLFLAANPITQASLRLDEEARAVREKIRLSKFRDVVKFETRCAVRPSDIFQAINECQPSIIHFSGHGSSKGELLLQDENGAEKLVTIPAITQALKNTSEDIRFVFFNSCFSRGQAESAVLHVEGAIGMNSDIGDDAARIFAAQFYSAIGFGKSVAVAFAQAKAALMLENIPEENTPELFLQDGIEGERFILVEPN